MFSHLLANEQLTYYTEGYPKSVTELPFFLIESLRKFSFRRKDTESFALSFSAFDQYLINLMITKLS